MGRDILNLDTSLAARLVPEGLDLQDLEVVRLLLSGDSVVDWHKLDLDTPAKVARYLRMHRYDAQDPDDQERLRFLFNQAVNYLEEHQDIRFPKDLRDPERVEDILLAASTWSGRFRRRQALACMILKLMHTINHMDAADLKQRLPTSETELFDRAEKSIIAYADRLRAEGYPVMAFYGSRKTRNSVISKLLTKKENLAATIFDKLRFRVVVESGDEVMPMLAHLTHTLFPFNYLIPGASHNNLVNLRRVIREDERFAALAPKMQRLRGRASELLSSANPFSSTGYRMVSFIVDYPVDVRDIVATMDRQVTLMLGRVVYVMVEFQVVDKATSDANEEGANSHHLYKQRQRKVVEARLLRGSLARR